ncbi:MAG TPA: toprim domain-containing protein [Candidatus Nanoarchaeia archaeon]|nr:toprim domain-containing protein [Candidatus Nanoarchaeia archaeon]
MEEIELLLDWIERLREGERIIVVEGKEDKAALHRLGIDGVIQLNRRPLFKIVEELVAKERPVIILTDLDKKGKQLYSKLNHDLNQFGVRIDNRFRHFLFRHTQLRQIEGLDSYLERKNKKGFNPLRFCILT